MQEVIQVGMGEYAIDCAPGQLVTLGLGSCIGVCMYDSRLKLGALAHIMLADSKAIEDVGNPTKFADTAVPFLLWGDGKARFRPTATGGEDRWRRPDVLYRGCQPR